MLPSFIASAARHALTAGGVYLADKEFIPGMDVEGFVAAGLFILGMGWSIYHKKKVAE